MPGRRRGSRSSSATCTSKLRGGGQEVKSALARALMLAMWAFSSLSGRASTRTVACVAERQASTFHLVHPRRAEQRRGIGQFRDPAPGHTRSPSLKSCGFIQLPERQFRRMFTTPSRRRDLERVQLPPALSRSSRTWRAFPAAATLALPPRWSLDSLADASRSFCWLSSTLRPRCSPSTRERMSLCRVVELSAVDVVVRLGLGRHALLLLRPRLRAELLDLRLESAQLALLLLERAGDGAAVELDQESPFFTAVPLRTSFMIRRSPASDGAVT